MPSLLHEGILALVREKPAFAAELLREVLHVPVPAFTSARLAEATLNDLVPTEYRNRPANTVVTPAASAA
jgi:hypothetical protein